ncbi:penicillin-binding transpeptidase domain-containing protein [uncultured Clostridium sp.]|uniref:penicillin-binding transpeptidase domain-containing protein n=1 Tax=uncultured Clostridium sp. TaxID=59620 RepID=UPI002621536F|nr:penicillin-binding transpeptidase domain-containing protein [uncultured Clostridium sp.]
MFSKEYILKDRIKKVKFIMVTLLVILIFRVYYIQNKYNPVVTGTEYNNSIEKEEVGDYKYLLLDRNGKDLNNYTRKYKIIIDGDTFKMNSMNQNLENFISFNYIMEEAVKEFDVNKITSSGNIRYTYEISEETYKKVGQLKGVKGMYAYQYDEKTNINNWSIESILMKDKAYNPQKQEDNYLKSADSLEGEILNYTKDNEATSIMFEKDIDGIYSEVKYEVNPDNNNIGLTIDKDYQEAIREVLNREEYSIHENIGVALVKSSTGEVLSIAQKDELAPNLVTGGGVVGYEPGSTFKVVTLGAAMKYNNVTLSDMYECKGKICKEFNVHGKINLQKAMEVSCNDIFAELGAEVDYNLLVEYAKEQGYFTSVLNLDLSTGMESTGAIANIAESQGNFPIGQGAQSTPIQVVASLSTIVNGGFYIEPFLMKEVKNQDGKEIKKFSGEQSKVLDEFDANIIKNLLIDCVNNGTGKEAQIEGVEIGGKTGTTESVGNSSHGWFLGYFKMDDEYYNMVVFVPNIDGKGEAGQELGGGNTATPIFKEIVLELLKK